MKMKQDDRYQPTSSQNLRVCQWCGYDANPLNTEFCEVCDRPLDQKPILSQEWLNQLGSGFAMRLAGFSVLMLLLGGLTYGLAINQPAPTPEASSPSPEASSPSPEASPSPAASSPIASATPTAPVAAPGAEIPDPDISNAADIRIYRTFSDVPNVPKGLFSYSSALTFASLKIYGMNDKIQQSHPEFQLRYTEPPQGNRGSTTAIKMLIEGEVSMAQSSRPLEDEELNRARSRQLTLDQIPFALDGIVFYVHPDLPIAGLSLTQIQDIYAGKVTNWREVGGPDLPIVAISLDPKVASAPKQALGAVADKMGQTVQIIRDHNEGIRRVSSTRGAISFGGGSSIIGQKLIRLLSIARANSSQYISPVTVTGEIDQQVFRTGSYPITHRVFVVIRRNGSLEEQAGVAYANLLLSGEGQRIIESVGFVPLY